MLREHVARLLVLLGEAANPYLLQPPTDMAKRRKNSIGKRPSKPRKAGRLTIARPRTKRKRRRTVQQNALVKIQQARRNRDASGMLYWNIKFAKHSRNQ